MGGDGTAMRWESTVNRKRILLVALVLLIAGGMTLNAPGVEDPTTDVPGIDPEDVGDTPPDANDNT